MQEPISGPQPTFSHTYLVLWNEHRPVWHKTAAGLHVGAHLLHSSLVLLRQLADELLQL